MSTEEKLEACKRGRGIAARSLLEALKELHSKKKISEVSLRDAWLREMQKYPTLLSEGWYRPPPQGFIILFGSEKNKERLDFKSARPQEWWPKENVFLDSEGIAYVYASPVDRISGIIGDLGLTLYFGKNPSWIKHAQDCYRISRELCDYLKIGMTLSEVYQQALQLISSKGLTNDILSVTDPASANIGHTVPASYEDWPVEEQGILHSGDEDKIKDRISKKRRFVNAIETLKIKPGMALTMEPRLKVIDHPEIPMMFYHLIVLFHEDGKKEVLANLDDLFRWAKMEYML